MLVTDSFSTVNSNSVVITEELKMSGESRKINKQNTGTIPKIKHRNYMSNGNISERRSSRSLTNNLSLESQGVDSFDFVRNSSKSSHKGKYHMMETALPDQEIRQDGLSYSNSIVNDSAAIKSPSTSGKNSSGAAPKCDNMPKYPDRKRVEEKLQQIREYLQITTALMSNMKSTEDQVKENGAPESFAEESTSASYKNEIEDRVEHCSKEVESQKEQSLNLQQKSENKLREARKAQERLVASQRNYLLNMTNKNEKNFTEIDEAIKQLEERTKRCRELNGRKCESQEKMLSDRVDSLQSQLSMLHDANEERQSLIQILDNRDAELRTQHVELQSKLSELQKKKLQVDQLVVQLQTMEGSEEDVGFQVKKIITMKEQLAKLKDMLEIVQNTENLMNNISASPEEQEAACDIYNKAESFLQKKEAESHHQIRTSSESNFVLNYDNNAIHSHNEHYKDNKIAYDQLGAKPKRTVNTERSSLKRELEAKRRELEALMGKHKTGTSNLNHDVSNDHKMESVNSNALFEGSYSQWPLQNKSASEKYSSDEGEDHNDYLEMESSQCQLAHGPMIVSDGRQKTDTNMHVDHSQHVDYEHLSTVSKSPDINTRRRRSTSLSNSEQAHHRIRTDSILENKNQVQHQIELIKSVCESMLEQHSPPSNQSSRVQQVRNNLTPSPIHSEPRRYFSPHSQSTNALNVMNTHMESPWNLPINDSSSYQSWLTTNTLQAQAFMMNSLNQCCQMLWLQQREMANLRQVVTMMQEQVQLQDPANPHLPSTIQSPMDSYSSNYQNRRSNQSKVNHVSSACSMPNLNHCSQPAPLTDNSYNFPMNNMQLPPNNAQCPLNNTQFLLNNTHFPLNNSQFPLNNTPYSSNNNSQFPTNSAEFPSTNNTQFPPSNSTQFLPSNNMLHSARLLESSINNMTHLNSHHGVDHVNNMLQVNSNPSHQMWNEPALNNQVAPGNRANNYWDNFRSYSRQNLLSSKSNEGFHNVVSTLERPNRAHPFLTLSHSKSNSEHESASTSQENTPRRRINIGLVKGASNYSKTPIPPSDMGTSNYNKTNIPSPDMGVNNYNKTTIPPPDVLNVNHNNSENSGNSHVEGEKKETLGSDFEESASYQAYLNTMGGNDAGELNIKIAGNQIFKECIPETCRRKNEWKDNVDSDDCLPKSKLFEELRENVYKEVATLISANEARPHFLIQLFRDLQMISSDNLRLKTLQSIQSVLTLSSYVDSQASSNAAPLQSCEQIPHQSDDFCTLQTSIWNKHVKNTVSAHQCSNSIDIEENLHVPLKELIPFLNDHEEEIIQNHFLVGLKEMLINSDSFQEAVKDSIFQKHFSNVLDDVLEQFLNKKIKDIKIHLIQTLNEILKGELSFIQLIQETCPDSIELGPLPPTYQEERAYELTSEEGTAGGLQDCAGGVMSQANVVDTLQNGDLAEADQSREESNGAEEEEGAVGGGFLDGALGAIGTSIQEGSVTVEYAKNDESESKFGKQGLDQVPTRLPTKSKSPSNTPIRDQSTSRSENHLESF